jgi:hypothetical protein
MKKFISTLSVTGLYLILAGSAFATNTVSGCSTGIFNVLCGFTFGGNFIAAFINILFIIAILIALIYLIWGGIKWIMSGGDKSSLQSAREHVIAAIVGLVVVFLTYFIINILLTVFGIGANGYNFTLPTFNG